MDATEEDQFFYPPPDISVILDHVYLGSGRALSAHVISEYRIAHIIRCVKGSTRADDLVGKSIFPMDDTGKSNLRCILEEALPVMDNVYEHCKREKCSMFVHCSAGVNRSATLLVAWIMHKFNMNLKTAHRIVEEGRPKICIHDCYMKQLRQLDIDMHGEYSTGENELLTTSIAMKRACDLLQSHNMPSVTSKDVFAAAKEDPPSL
mmetsp:Transcript_14473/g.21766  ORF Transcript_14473/g.21766 Transcript_14473/m.21766 type:complete len:206 (+) Transcript_14473:87-704(+)